MREITLDALTKNVPVVTDFIDEQLDEIGCSPKSRMQIDIAIDEVFSNIAYYAYDPLVGPATIQIEVDEENMEVVLVFKDRGVPYDPLTHTDPNTKLPLEERGVGGLGIFMVKQSMDLVEYEYVDGHNVLKLTKKINQ